MSVPRRLAALLAMVAAVLGMVLVAPSAQAETPQLAPPPELQMHPNWSWEIIGEGRDRCNAFRVCIWASENFRGYGVGFYGNVVPGNWVTWFGTTFQDGVHSAVNKGTAHVTFYDIYGSQWTPLGALHPGYDFSSGWPGSGRADGLCAYQCH